MKHSITLTVETDDPEVAASIFRGLSNETFQFVASGDIEVSLSSTQYTSFQSGGVV
jgi:hypothetical protein